MSTSLHLCGPDDLPQLARLCERFHSETGITLTEEERLAALAPILDGSPLAVAYLAGPRAAPIGYIIVSFGWSVELGGMDGFVDELWVRPSVRGRGLGSEIVSAVSGALASAGLKALHLEVDRTNAQAQRIYGRAGFTLRDRYCLMTRES